MNHFCKLMIMSISSKVWLWHLLHRFSHVHPLIH